MEEKNEGLLTNLLGSPSMDATLNVKLQRETYFYLGVTIVSSLLIGMLVGAIAKDTIVGK